MATSILKSTFKSNLVKSLLFEVISKTSRYHYVFGRKEMWPDVYDDVTGEQLSGESDPPAVSDTFPYELEARNDIIYSKLIDSNDVAAVVQRYNWAANYIYDMYDEYSADNPSVTGAVSLSNSMFYVLTDEYNVYKCLDNNKGAKSLVKPTGTSREPVTYSDGYIWKYMYTIPLYLRNKFLTSNVMPVITALTSQFYSNGSITSYAMQSRGSDYVKTTSYGVSKIVIIDGGVNYDVLDFEIDFPEPAQQAAATATINGSGEVDGLTIDFGGYGYYDSIPPSVTVSAPDQPEGTQAIISVTVVDGSITAYSIDNAGSGYTSAPTVTIEIPPNGVSEGDKRKPTIDGIFIDEISGEVLNIVFSDPGAGYTVPPEPIITTTVGTGLQYKVFYEKDTFTELTVNGDGYDSTNPYSLKSVTIENPGLYTNVPTGELVTFPATNINGNRPVVKVEFAQYLTGDNTGKYYISAVHVLDEGKGYTSPLLWYGASNTNRVEAGPLVSGTNVEIAAVLDLNTSTQKNQASLLPVINPNGEIEAVLVQKSGIGYTYASVTVTSKITTYINNTRTTETLSSSVRPNFSAASIQLDFGIGQIDSKQSDVELTAVDGAIYACRIDVGGLGYDNNTTLTVIGDGEGCQLTPVIGTGGAITKILVTNPGRNYRNASVVVTGAGSNASITPIIAPKGGHGKDAIDELYASTLLFTSRIINEKINNIVPLESGYRRVSIIKNIKKYGLDETYQNANGNTCVLLTAEKSVNNTTTFSDINISTDQNLYFGSLDNEYLIIEAYETDDKYYILILPKNTSQVPVAGTSLYLAGGQKISISSVSVPTINKYSGDMIYLENRTKFYSTDEQAVRISTSITF